MSSQAGKRKLLVVLFALYVTFIIISTIPYIAEQNLKGVRAGNEDFVSNLVFPRNGSYDHYKQVNISNNAMDGKINLKYTFDTNTLYINKVENIKKLEIDCQLLFSNRYKDIFGKEPLSLETADFITANDGLFTVIINTDTPMEKLKFSGTPIPKDVKVNKIDWWQSEIKNYTIDNNDITITYIPKGSTTVEIYFTLPVGKSPNAWFTANNYIALRNETIIFNASGSYDEDGQIIDYIWDLGDSTKNITKIISHSYSNSGNYTVMLTVRDNADLVDVFTEKIVIVESNKNFEKVIVDDVEIDIRSVKAQNLSIKREVQVPEIPESTGNDFNFFLNITSQEEVSRFQLKIDLGPIGGPIIPAGTDPDLIKLFYYNETLNKWMEIADSYYDPETGILTAKLDHLTVFAPMSKEASSQKDGEDVKGEEGIFEGALLYVLIIIIVIVVLTIIGVVLKKRGKGKKRIKHKEPRGGHKKIGDVGKGDFECPDCGVMISEDQSECSKCGATLAWEEEEEEISLENFIGTSRKGPPPKKKLPEKRSGKMKKIQKSSIKTKKPSRPDGLMDYDLPFLTLGGKTIAVPPSKEDSKFLDDELHIKLLEARIREIKRKKKYPKK